MVMVMIMVMILYGTFSIIIFKSALQATDLWVRSDISKISYQVDPRPSVGVFSAVFKFLRLRIFQGLFITKRAETANCLCTSFTNQKVSQQCNDVDSDKLTKDRRLCSQNVNARHHRTYEIHTRARRLVSGPLHATCIVTNRSVC